jgi:Raf kinase inhibitor-like YbhB/YbcL family protein
MLWEDQVPMTDVELSSTAFEEGQPIPERYSCDGDNASPPLSWTSLPEGTRSLALIVHDPDAPSGDFTHWLAWNIDPGSDGLEEDVPAPLHGTNGFGRPGYGAPCPPPGDGPHRYYFELYALDTDLDLLESGAAREQLEREMEGHVLGQARLMGTYERK